MRKLSYIMFCIMPTGITLTMSQQWFSQHGPAAASTNPSQLTGNMHHQRYHHGNAPAPGSGPASAYARSSPPLGRPPSSASVGSASSYHSAPGPAPGPGPVGLNRHQGHGMEPGPRSSAPHPSHLHNNGHSGIRSMTSGRYPMPPRNGMVHPVRPIPRGPMPVRQHHGMHPTGPMGHPRPGSVQGHPMRTSPNGMPSSEYSHSGHSQYAAKPGSSLLGRPGHAPMHHNMPYRHMHSMGAHGNAHGYHQNSHPNSYSHGNHGQISPQHPEQTYQRFQNRATGESPSVEKQFSSRSPSPPPAPPSTHELSHQTKTSPSLANKIPETSPTGPLRERQNVQNGEQNSVLQSKTAVSPARKPANEDLTADAASILLQLSAVVKKEGETENRGNDENSGNQENKPMDSIEQTHSIDDFSTVAPSETTDSAPDLTSEPSSDSIEHESEFPAAIPENYPTRLALPYDDSKLNSLHCFLRSELLEIFVVQKSLNKSPTHSPGSSVGRVGLRCVHCALTKRQRDDRDEAPMAVFYPKSIAEIYRLVTSWQRCHLRKCRNLPPAVRSKWQLLRENDKSRGKTHYWITSAKEIGLVNCQSRAGGIRFGPVVNKHSGPSKKEASTDAADPTEAVSGPSEPTSSEGVSSMETESSMGAATSMEYATASVVASV